MRRPSKTSVTPAAASAAAGSLAAIAGILAVLRRRRGRLPGRALIVSPRNSTVFAQDGGVRSVQSAELTVPADDLERLWSPGNLENLARTYWYFLSRVTLGIIRVIYGEGERRVVLLVRPLTLLRFDAPKYILEQNHGKVTWQIRGGLLVARPGRESGGFLALDVERCPGVDESGQSKLLIEVEVSNFYPSIAASFSQLVYGATQSFIHVLVTHAFLRSLAKLELAESKVGRLSPPEPVGGPPPA